MSMSNVILMVMDSNACNTYEPRRVPIGGSDDCFWSSAARNINEQLY